MKKNFFILISFFFLIFLLPTEGNTYSNDPKQFISEIVLETKNILNSNVDKELKSNYSKLYIHNNGIYNYSNYSNCSSYSIYNCT